MYDYDPRTFNDLKIRKEDLLYIGNFQKGQWLKAKHEWNNQKGFVPANYIAEVGSIQAEL